MASFLATGEGASGGLEEVLHRMMQEQALARQQTESERHNRSDEGLRGLQIQELSADRRLREKERDDLRTDANAAKTDANVMRRVALRPIGADVTPDEKTSEVAHGIPMGNYTFRPANMGMSTPQGEVGPNADAIKWSGTQDQITKKEQAERERGAAGAIEETPQGLVRVDPSNGVTPIYDNDGKQVQKFHQPIPPSIIQTDSGFARVPKTAGPATPITDAGGGQVQPKETGQIANRRDLAQTVAGKIPEVQKELDDARDSGALGPIEGRLFTDFLAGRVGSTGDDNLDELLGHLRMNMSAIRTGFAAMHGRGGANLGNAHEVERQMDASHMSYRELKGALDAMSGWVNTYAKPKSGTGAGGPPATDMYNEYLKRFPKK